MIFTMIIVYFCLLLLIFSLIFNNFYYLEFVIIIIIFLNFFVYSFITFECRSQHKKSGYKFSKSISRKFHVLFAKLRGSVHSRHKATIKLLQDPVTIAIFYIFLCIRAYTHIH